MCRTWEVTGQLLVTDYGLTKGTTGHVSVLVWVQRHLAGSFVFLVFFKFRKYAQEHYCDWTSCNTLKMQWVCLIIMDDEQNCICCLKKKKRRSILLVLPDIFMFNMRVLLP